MTSQINPNNIDGAYPIAGQDNNSQGFRDNFTNIKTNFQYAEDEIDDLQSKVVLKAALTGSSLDNNMGDNLIYAAKIQDFSATKVAVTGTSGSIAINYASGHYQTITAQNSISLSFNNWPAAGSYGWIRLQINVTSPSYTVTLPSAVSLGTTGIQGLSSNVITFAQSGYYEFAFTTSDGGTTITVFDLNRPLNVYTNPLSLGSTLLLNSSEDLANGAAASLTKTASYFTTGVSAETATLAAGSAGQIKTFMMSGYTSPMVITVTNPGWGGSGTITFSAVGQGCTLQYVNSKWYCIGNNGASFA